MAELLDEAILDEDVGRLVRFDVAALAAGHAVAGERDVVHRDVLPVAEVQRVESAGLLIAGEVERHVRNGDVARAVLDVAPTPDDGVVSILADEYATRSSGVSALQHVHD